MTKAKRLKHVGVFKGRISVRPREAVFASAWAKRAREIVTPEFMAGETADPAIVPTQRDATVAATVIQWLGSPVGSVWLREVLKNADAAERADRLPKAPRLPKSKPPLTLTDRFRGKS